MPTAPPPIRPTTPLRTPSRLSQRASSQTPTAHTLSSSSTHNQTPLTHLEPAFAELSDAVSDLESNMALLHLQHESISRFTENFAGFLYGLDMNAYCVDWVEAPTAEVWARQKRRERERERQEIMQNSAMARMTPPVTAGVGVGAGTDVSLMSTTSTRTASSAAMSTRGSRTPARRSGIARASMKTGVRGGYASRSGSGVSSVASTREGFAGNESRGRGRGVGVVSLGGRRVRGSRGSTNGWGRERGDVSNISGIGRGRGSGRGGG